MAKKLFKSGESGNPKGRPKGAQNKVTAKAKEAFIIVMELLEDRMKNKVDVIERLSPTKAAELYVNLLNYVKPKLTSNKNDNLNTDNELTISVKYIDSNDKEIKAPNI